MSQARQIWFGGSGLAFAAVLIWSRDTQWMSAAADTLPLALGIPLAFILGRPWHAGTTAWGPLQKIGTALGLLSLGVGWIIGNLTVLSAGWTLLAMSWAGRVFQNKPRRARLGLLLLLSFPWLVIEWQSIGWAFRLSSAVTAEEFFKLLQMPAQRSGTNINVMGVPIEIEAACAGWNLLQLTLLAGVSFGAHEIQSPLRFGFLMCLLPAVVWLSNVFRILLLSGIALSFDVEVASGAIHGLTGIAVLGTVLAMTKGLCTLLDTRRRVISTLVTAT